MHLLIVSLCFTLFAISDAFKIRSCYIHERQIYSQIFSSLPVNDEVSKTIVKSQLNSAPSIPRGNKLITGQQVVRCRDFSIDGQRTFKFIGSFHSYNSIPASQFPDISFLGRSNVGKSSMLNCLAGGGKPIAIESKTPGRTRAINLFHCTDSAGDICNFVDLPGYGFAKMSKSEKEELSQVVHEYLHKRESLMLCIVLIDPRRGPMESDYSLLNMLVEKGIPFVITPTKVDKLSKTELAHQIHKIAEAYGLPTQLFLPFSSSSGCGRKEVWRVIHDSILRKGIAHSWSLES